MSKQRITNKLIGIANCNNVNPEAAKASFLVIIYPKRQIFPRKNDIQKKVCPIFSIIFLFIIFNSF